MTYANEAVDVRTVTTRTGRVVLNRMKTELIATITDAERQAAQEKERAAAQADRLVKDAESKAKNALSASADVCKAFFETQIRLATAQSEKRYAEELKQAGEAAEARSREALKNADVSVSGIVQRVVYGEDKN